MAEEDAEFPPVDWSKAQPNTRAKPCIAGRTHKFRKVAPQEGEKTREECVYCGLVVTVRERHA